MPSIQSDQFKYDGSHKVNISEFPKYVGLNYKGKKDFKKQLKEITSEIDELQNMMYAHNQYGMLVVFQAMDAAGKDSTIKAVFNGVHPLGTSFVSFKRPSSKELDHDFMWRCFKELPERGKIKVFNRSYYEEVLVVKVHDDIIDKYQQIPIELKKDKKKLWQNRYKDISNFENYLQNNGIVVLKFFLNVSKEEQGSRLIDRINKQEKNWKFEEGDIKERALWGDYMTAYQDMLQNTATTLNPWHVIPADDKKNMRLIVASAIRDKLKTLEIEYPASSDERQKELESFITVINQQNKA